MYIRRLLAGLIDRIAILLIFVCMVFCVYGLYASAGYLGRYEGGCVNGRPSNYEVLNDMGVYDLSKGPIGVDKYYWAQEALANMRDGYMDIETIDYKLTSLFIISNLIYLLLTGLLIKRTIGEFLCGVYIQNIDGKYITRFFAVWRVLIYMLLILFMIWFRNVIDSTYLIVSIMLLMLNWMLIIARNQSIVDLFTFTKPLK